MRLFLLTLLTTVTITWSQRADLRGRSSRFAWLSGRRGGASIHKTPTVIALNSRRLQALVDESVEAEQATTRRKLPSIQRQERPVTTQRPTTAAPTTTTTTTTTTTPKPTPPRIPPTLPSKTTRFRPTTRPPTTKKIKDIEKEKDKKPPPPPQLPKIPMEIAKILGLEKLGIPGIIEEPQRPQFSTSGGILPPDGFATRPGIIGDPQQFINNAGIFGPSGPPKPPLPGIGGIGGFGRPGAGGIFGAPDAQPSGSAGLLGLLGNFAKQIAPGGIGSIITQGAQGGNNDAVSSLLSSIGFDTRPGGGQQPQVQVPQVQPTFSGGGSPSFPQAGNFGAAAFPQPQAPNFVPQIPQAVAVPQVPQAVAVPQARPVIPPPVPPVATPVGPSPAAAIDDDLALPPPPPPPNSGIGPVTQPKAQPFPPQPIAQPLPSFTQGGSGSGLITSPTTFGSGLAPTPGIDSGLPRGLPQPVLGSTNGDLPPRPPATNVLPVPRVDGAAPPSAPTSFGAPGVGQQPPPPPIPVLPPGPAVAPPSPPVASAVGFGPSLGTATSPNAVASGFGGGVAPGGFGSGLGGTSPNIPPPNFLSETPGGTGGGLFGQKAPPVAGVPRFPGLKILPRGIPRTPDGNIDTLSLLSSIANKLTNGTTLVDMLPANNIQKMAENMTSALLPKTPAVDLDKFMGRWFEGINSPRATEERCVVHHYGGLTDNDKSATFTALKIFRDGNEFGQVKYSVGYAFRSGHRNGMLQMHASDQSEPTPFWIYKLGPEIQDHFDKTQYAYAVISNWVKYPVTVLVRDPDEFKAKYQREVLYYLRRAGFLNQFTEVFNMLQAAEYSHCQYSENTFRAFG